MPPLAIITSLIGLAVDDSKKFALAGFVISGVTCLLFTLPAFT